MKINRFREPGLSEDYIDIHYRNIREDQEDSGSGRERSRCFWGNLEGEQVFLKPEEYITLGRWTGSAFACLEGTGISRWNRESRPWQRNIPNSVYPYQ